MLDETTTGWTATELRMNKMRQQKCINPTHYPIAACMKIMLIQRTRRKKKDEEPSLIENKVKLISSKTTGIIISDR